MAKNLLDLMKMVIRFYMESAIASTTKNHNLFYHEFRSINPPYGFFAPMGT
jgi:hypothetical protein